jgi:hypothetical protein
MRDVHGTPFTHTPFTHTPFTHTPFTHTPWPRRKEATVTRNNILYLTIGALVVVVAVLSYQLYQDRRQPQGVHIEVGPNGLSIEKK